MAIRFTHRHTRKTVSLGISVEPHDWDKDAEIVTSDCPERLLLQSKIDSILAIYRKKIQRLEASDMEVDFTNLFGQTAKCTPQLADSCFERKIAAMKQAGRINTVIKYTATRTSLGKFHPAELRFEEIDGKFSGAFEAFLHSAGNQPNSIATKFNVLKALSVIPFNGEEMLAWWLVTPWLVERLKCEGQIIIEEYGCH